MRTRVHARGPVARREWRMHSPARSLSGHTKMAHAHTAPTMRGSISINRNVRARHGESACSFFGRRTFYLCIYVECTCGIACPPSAHARVPTPHQIYVAHLFRGVSERLAANARAMAAQRICFYQRKLLNQFVCRLAAAAAAATSSAALVTLPIAS